MASSGCTRRRGVSSGCEAGSHRRRRPGGPHDRALARAPGHTGAGDRGRAGADPGSARRVVPSADPRDARAFRRHRGHARDRHQGAALADRDRRKGVIAEWDLGLIADLTPYPYRFHLEQHRLTPILYETLKAFPHAQVHFSTGFVDAQQSGDTVTVKTTSGELKTPWLVGCDGGRSTVRKHLGTPFEGFTWPERFVVISTLADFAQHGFTSNAYVADPREWAAVFH